jgi:hypothetical protein
MIPRHTVTAVEEEGKKEFEKKKNTRMCGLIKKILFKSVSAHCIIFWRILDAYVNINLRKRNKKRFKRVLRD